MAYGRRKKGGQRLMELAKKSGAQKRARKLATAKRLKEQVDRNFAKADARKPRGSTTTSKPTSTRKPHRTPAQRAADKKKLEAELKKVEAAGKKKSLTRFIPQMSVKKAGKAGSGLRIGGEIGLAIAALAGSGGTAAPAVAGTRGGQAVLSALSKAKNLLKGKPKPKPKPSTATMPVRPSGTPAKPSGRGPASGGRKASGPGSRSRTRRTSAESPSKKIQRQKKRDAKKTERRERLDSGGVRVGIQKRKSALTRGRRTQAQKRAARQKRKKYNL